MNVTAKLSYCRTRRQLLKRLVSVTHGKKVVKKWRGRSTGVECHPNRIVSFSRLANFLTKMSTINPPWLGSCISQHPSSLSCCSFSHYFLRDGVVYFPFCSSFRHNSIVSNHYLLCFFIGPRSHIRTPGVRFNETFLNVKSLFVRNNDLFFSNAHRGQHLILA